MASMMRPRRAAAVAILVVVAAVAWTSLSSARASDPLTGARTFAFAIGNHMLDGGAQTVGDRFAPFDVVVVDGEEATAADIAAMRSHGTVVLGYLSVGTIEKWRSWYPELRPYRLNADQNWRDEWFADASAAGFRNAIVDDIAPDLLAKGFDGLFLDNVDMIETHNHVAQRAGMKALVSRLAALVHGEGGLLFAQNGAWILNKLDMTQYLDGWNREDVTWTYAFGRHRYVRVGRRAHHEAVHELADFSGRGLFVTATDYTAHARGRPVRQSVRAACGRGALPYVSNIGLTLARLPDPPLSCP
jgi:uncharacterized protein (TIGR01370 family)